MNFRHAILLKKSGQDVYLPEALMANSLSTILNFLKSKDLIKDFKLKWDDIPFDSTTATVLKIFIDTNTPQT